jgi:hypothetical protein
MHDAPFDPPQSDRNRLRLVVHDIEHQLSCLAREASAADHRVAIHALTASWATMVGLLALGTAPDLRACPACGHDGMRAATRCGRCWIPLLPEAGARPS